MDAFTAMVSALLLVGVLNGKADVAFRNPAIVCSPVVSAKEGSFCENFSTYRLLVGLVLLWCENQLYFAHSVLPEVQVRIDFVLKHTDRCAQLKQPIFFRSVAFLRALS